jgi:S-methylmethionine-dependent homocysteine/selenocysteine methylase
MKQYHELYLQLAERYQLTYVLETPTWRANRDWIYRLGYNTDETVSVNRHAVQFIRETQHNNCDVIISGSVGPRRNDFDTNSAMTSDESAQYHSEQIRTFALLDVDVVTARAYNNSNEAIGVAKVCRGLGVPLVISFNVDASAKLGSGESLEDAIMKVDQETSEYASYYTLHCIGGEALEQLIQRPGDWKRRLHGIQTNDNNSTFHLSALKDHFPNLQLVGGCGFDFSTLDDLCRQFATV